mgnify:CR=1 FL=1
MDIQEKIRALQQERAIIQKAKIEDQPRLMEARARLANLTKMDGERAARLIQIEVDINNWTRRLREREPV